MMKHFRGHVARSITVARIQQSTWQQSCWSNNAYYGIYNNIRLPLETTQSVFGDPETITNERNPKTIGQDWVSLMLQRTYQNILTKVWLEYLLWLTFK